MWYNWVVQKQLHSISNYLLIWWHHFPLPIRKFTKQDHKNWTVPKKQQEKNERRLEDPLFTSALRRCFSSALVPLREKWSENVSGNLLSFFSCGPLLKNILSIPLDIFQKFFYNKNKSSFDSLNQQLFTEKKEDRKWRNTPKTVHERNKLLKI